MKIQIVEKSQKLVTCYFNSHGRGNQQKLRCYDICNWLVQDFFPFEYKF